MKKSNNKGIFIVFCGPDGCGKSSVAEKLGDINGIFDSKYSQYYHWKPLPQRHNTQISIEDPHGKPVRNLFVSLLYFVYHYLPFIYGYYRYVRPALQKKGLVIIDRYYYDFFVDLKRYRLNISQWIVKLGYILIKKPDLVFCLDADPEILQARKREVTFEECKRQRNEYRKLVENIANGYIIDASMPLQNVIDNVRNRIIETATNSNQNIDFFFKTGAPVIAIPNWKKPRLYITSVTLKQRWQDTALYPAFNTKAKLYKLLLRTMASIKLMPVRYSSGNDIFHKYKIDCDRNSLLMGTTGPYKKLVIKCMNKDGNTLSYIKYGKKELAKIKLKNEYNILLSANKMKDITAPTPLQYSENNDEVILQITPVSGAMLEAKLPDIKQFSNGISDDLRKIQNYLKNLYIKEELYSIHEHPAILELQNNLMEQDISKSDFNDILAMLSHKKWPRVILHGDFAPWNILENKSNNQLCAIDWEEGSINGFPHFDFIHYVTQVAALNLKWSEYKTLNYLTELLNTELNKATAPIIKLALLNSFVHLRCTLGKSHMIQNWRKTMWEITS
jgi:thymidylate kinase